MADDIDIEEHDVLDDPKLKNIFPDITNIKTEVVDYEEDENEYQEIYIDPNEQIKTEPIECESRDLPVIHRNVIILGSKPSTPLPCINAATSSKETSTNAESLDYEDAQEYDEPEILPCSVVMEDWHTILSNNPCYCSKCQILFPTVNAIDFHRMSAHSFLVAVSNNKAIKSTSKSSIDEHTPMKDNSKRIELLCKHCNVYYPDEIALIKHKYSLIPHTCKVCKEVFSDEETLKSHQMTHSVEEELYIICTMCSCVFKKEDSFIGHISLNHGNPRMEKVMAPFKPKCVHCNKSISLPKNYNAHMRIFHQDLFFMKIDREKQLQCHLCKLTFPSALAERIHRATKHPTNMKDYSTKARRVIECTKKFDKKVVSKYKKSDKTVDIKPIIYKAQSYSKNVDVNTLIPKSILYKCNKCQIHFISCTVAIEHSRNCTLSKGDWKCQSCRRSFKLDDRQIHMLQHALNERIKVIIVSDAILPRVLNKCGICNICFDVRTFAKHHAAGCRPSQSVECGVCHLLIHEFTVSKHLKDHRELSLTLNDFIISDYCTIDKSIIDKQSASTSVVPIKRRSYTARLPSYNTLYYCPNCRCYVSRNRKQDGHNIGECRGRGSKELCKLCGLQFTKKAILSHKMYHKIYTLQLSQITFINILNGKKVPPPFPEFKLCTNCRVYFFSNIALKNHVCNTEEHKSCKYCNEKFSDLALKLHLPFHQYSNPALPDTKRPIAAPAKRYTGAIAMKRPIALAGTASPSTETVTKPIFDLMKKYESLVTIWNILYRCQMCDIVLDSYNSVVEHCQDHYCNMENYNVNISYCKKCKLKFVDKCYSRHEELHLENNIDVSSFIIIDYDFSTLLSDDWLKIFDQLSKHQLQQILSKSIYNEIRGVRMALVWDGTLGCIYRCSLCNYSIDVQSIVDHVRNKECESAVKHTCTICDIVFQHKNSVVAHENKHRISNEPFRIISFNEAKDAFINEALIKHTKADDLKFVRCQYCGKLINKGVYRNHIYKHTYNQKMILLQDRPQKTIEPAAVARVKCKSEQKGVYRFFLCGLCEVAMGQSTIHRHICSSESQKLKCKKCNLFFRASNFWKHNKIHEKYPKLSRKTISVTYLGKESSKNRDSFINESGKNTYSVIKANTPTIVNKTPSEDIASKDHVGDTTAHKLKFYECIFCQTCVTVRSADNHSCSSNRGRTKCPQCGIFIHASHFGLHKSLHNRISFNSKNIKIIKFKGKRRSQHLKSGKNIDAAEQKTVMKKYKKRIDTYDKFSSDTDTNSDFLIDHKFDYMRVYKCTSCSLLFVSRYNLLEHIINCKDTCDSKKSSKCEICNLIFHSSNINTHKAVQKCNRKNISVINICTLILNGSEALNDSNWVYYCKQCDFYSLNPMRHHMATQHKSVLRKIPCTTCDVKFASLCYRKHLHLHHKELNISFPDLNVEVLEDYTLEEAGYALQILDNILDSTQLSGNDENVIVGSSKIGQLYRCPTCNLHFLTRKSVYIHQYKKQHDSSTVTCTKCNLPFSVFALRSHLKMHNLYRSFKVTDAIINEHNSNRWKLSLKVSKSSKERKKGFSRLTISNENRDREPMNSNSGTVVVPESQAAPINEINQSMDLNDSAASTVKMKQKRVSNSYTVSSDEMQQTSENCHTNSTDEFKQRNISNSNRISSGGIKEVVSSNLNTASGIEMNQTVHLNSPPVSTAPIKLFKCSECDVYFLTAESCHDHTYNHAPLDPTEYIACKVCDLQFLCESLGRHMKGHREKTFNMDELVVDEYQPRGMNVTIDTYSANDRIKSKLVSTTTHSDND